MQTIAAAVLIGWIISGLLLGYLMRRRGYEGYAWTVIGLFLGPLGLVLAIPFVRHPPSSEPRLLCTGQTGRGDADVLVGIDGSPESAAAVDAAIKLFGGRLGRLTLARVIPLDADPEVEALAERQLTEACLAHPMAKASTVILRGAPVAALHDYERRQDYDLLVVGARGSGKAHAILGSVATSLAAVAGSPVLIVGGSPILTSSAPVPRHAGIGKTTTASSDTRPASPRVRARPSI